MTWCDSVSSMAEEKQREERIKEAEKKKRLLAHEYQLILFAKSDLEEARDTRRNGGC